MKFKDVIEKILIENPKARDDDGVLLTEFYLRVYGVYYDFKGKARPETVTRIRRLLQKKNPELRGEKNEFRKEVAEVYRETKGKILLDF